MQAIFNERRETDRARVIMSGTIAFNQRQTTIDCVVQDYSDSGARIAVDHAALLPDDIDLLINRKGRAYSAEIVWRTETEAGVRFRPMQDDGKPVSLDWVRRLRACEAENRTLKARLDQLMTGR